MGQRNYSLTDKVSHYELTFVVGGNNDVDIDALVDESRLVELAKQKDVSVRVGHERLGNDAMNALFMLTLTSPRIYVFQRSERVADWLACTGFDEAMRWDDQKGYHLTEECWQRVQEQLGRKA